MRPKLLFAVLCLLEGSLWLLPLSQLSIVSFTAAASLSSLLLWGLSRRLPQVHSAAQPESARALPLLLATAGTFAIPAVMLAAAQLSLNGELIVAISACVPVAVLVLWQAQSSHEGNLPAALVAPLLGLAAIVLLLPLRLPVSTREWGATASCLLAAALISWCGTEAYHLVQAAPLRLALAPLFLGNLIGYLLSLAVLLVAGLAHSRASEPTSPLAFSASVVSLLATQALAALALRSLPPPQFATRFIAVPVVAAVEGYLFWRPTLSTRDLVAAALAAASILLSFRSSRFPGTVTVLNKAP